jgi:hypothetical protein
MLRDLEFRPEGETTFQPSATPWEPGFQGSARPERAPQVSAVAMSQSHVKNRILFRPFRAGTWLLDVVPGRCPGLICDCPFGATTQKAQHQNALARARTPRNHDQPRSLARESSRRDANRLRRSVLATHRIMPDHAMHVLAVLDVVPGRCPGLICDCPVRGEDPKAQHQNWRFGFVTRE